MTLLTCKTTHIKNKRSSVCAVNSHARSIFFSTTEQTRNDYATKQKQNQKKIASNVQQQVCFLMMYKKFSLRYKCVRKSLRNPTKRFR